MTDRVSEALGERGLSCDPIGEVTLRGFPTPTPLFVVRAAADVRCFIWHIPDKAHRSSARDT